MTWSNLETNFQEGEATQALISRDNDSVCAVASPPRVLTSGSGENLALVVDQNLHVFGAKGKETLFSVKLKTSVVALRWVEVRASKLHVADIGWKLCVLEVVYNYTSALTLSLFSDSTRQRHLSGLFVLCCVRRSALRLHGSYQKTDSFSFARFFAGWRGR